MQKGGVSRKTIQGLRFDPWRYEEARLEFVWAPQQAGQYWRRQVSSCAYIRGRQCRGLVAFHQKSGVVYTQQVHRPDPSVIRKLG